jgi:hypothetical protein
MVLLTAIFLQATAADAIAKTRAEKSYELSYKGAGRLPKGDAFERSGKGIWRAPGLLFLEGKASGNEKETALRAGVLHACPMHGVSFDDGPCAACGTPRRPTGQPRVWVHDVIHGWMKSDEASQAGAAAGGQNPDDVLAALARVAGHAAPAPDGFRITLQGGPAADLAAALVPGQPWDPQGAAVTAVLTTDARGRIAAMTLAAALRGEAGPLKLDLEVKLSGFGDVQIPKSLAGAAFTTRMQAAIEAELRRP